MTKYITEIDSRHTSLDNALVMASFELDLVERRVIFLLLSYLDSSETISSTDWYSLNVKDYAEMCSIKETKNAYQLVKEGVSRLFERKIEFSSPDSKRTKKFRWIQAIEYDEATHEVKLKWSHDIIPYISELQKNFTKFRNSSVIPIESKYAFRLYLMLESERYRGLKGEIRVNLSDLYYSWCVPEGSKEFKYFNRDILVKAIAELLKLQLARVEVAYIKENRKVVALIFRYELEKLEAKNYKKLV